MPADWFEDLMGFKELRYEETRANLEVVGSTLRSKVNKRSYTIGTLETPSLAELRDRAASIVGSLAGTLRVSNVVGDVGRRHRDPANRHALFQVASQFNLLEMTGPDVTPEHGVTRYAFDPTQGRRARSLLAPRRSIETTSHPLTATWVRRRTGRSTA